jgi:hypothetical protein
MTNPLKREQVHYGPVNWQNVAADRNAALRGRDMEWAVNTKGDGIYLRHTYDRQGPWQEWKPEPGETEATHAIVARAINVGLPMEEWTRLVRTGRITQEVRKLMQANV